MARVLCLQADCNETVELSVDMAMAVAEEILPPREREIEIVCPRGHRKVYVLRA
jgi:hypothetical protein